MKEEYREPLMDVVMLLSEYDDIICASGDDVDLDYSGDNWTGDNVD